MRISFKQCATQFVLILTIARSICEDVFTELENIDYSWPSVEISTTSNITDMECYREIKSDGFGKIFKLHLTLTERTKYKCILKLPTPSDIQFLELNFATRRTRAKLISGNKRSRPVLGSPSISMDSPKEDYGEFTVQCLHGFIVVSNPTPADSLIFMVKPVNDEAPIVTEEECSKSAHQPTRGHRDIFI